MAMTHGLPLPEGRVEGDHDQYHSALEKWRIVTSTLLVLRKRGAMVATLILLSSTLLLLITRMVWSGWEGGLACEKWEECGHGHLHSISTRQVERWP